MNIFRSLDAKDRGMLLITLALVGALLVTLAFFTPGENPDDNTVPNSYLTGQHGAKAAFMLLQQSGYAIMRWQRPLTELAEQSGPSTILILAEPTAYNESDVAAVATILEKGGRVVTTGLQGGLLMPANEVTATLEPSFAACEALPDGLDELAGGLSSSGPIWITPIATWKEDRSGVHTAYTCAGKPVVVTYPVGKGTVVWWASSTPLENASISRGKDLELLLNSVGVAKEESGQEVYWDESLHSAPPSQWDFVGGPVWPLLLFGSLSLMLLVILSFSRRSGPIRALPQSTRTTPIEFLEALGSLYRSTGATTTAMQIAWERFRAQAASLTGQRTAQLDAVEIAELIDRRFGALGKAMAADLVSAEEACGDEALKPRRALALIQSLRRHEETLKTARSRGGLGSLSSTTNTLEKFAG